MNKSMCCPAPCSPAACAVLGMLTPFRRITTAPPQQNNAVLWRIAGHNLEAGQKSVAPQRKIHVLSCYGCKKVPLMTKGRQGGVGLKKASTKTPPAGTKHSEEVVFCSKCPRKLCLTCYLGSNDTIVDRTTWVSLGRCTAGLR